MGHPTGEPTHRLELLPFPEPGLEAELIGHVLDHPLPRLAPGATPIDRAEEPDGDGDRPRSLPLHQHAAGSSTGAVPIPRVRPGRGERLCEPGIGACRVDEELPQPPSPELPRVAQTEHAGRGRVRFEDPVVGVGDDDTEDRMFEHAPVALERPDALFLGPPELFERLVEVPGHAPDLVRTHVRKRVRASGPYPGGSVDEPVE
jgi:hypothetical protein